MSRSQSSPSCNCQCSNMATLMRGDREGKVLVSDGYRYTWYCDQGGRQMWRCWRSGACQAKLITNGFDHQIENPDIQVVLADEHGHPSPPPSPPPPPPPTRTEWTEPCSGKRWRMRRRRIQLASAVGSTTLPSVAHIDRRCREEEIDLNYRPSDQSERSSKEEGDLHCHLYPRRLRMSRSWNHGIRPGTMKDSF